MVSDYSVATIESQYQPRNLAKGQKVTRFAPSPTGFMHIGGLYTALIAQRLAQQSGGVFYLRIEDTDKKRELASATALIVNALNFYNIIPDEGPCLNGQQVGAYGPYVQSERMRIYQAYVQKLLDAGKAYRCFLSAADLDNIKTAQEQAGVRPGYYGEWARSRQLSAAEIEHKLAQQVPFVVRFKSPGHYERKISVRDLVRGHRELPENDLDVIIMKSDGLPTYHFAHVIDDHLMGTTHVVRGDEWFSSLPLHLQLFQALGWRPPEYIHIAPIQKLDNGSRRKLSKRQDPEASMTYYQEQGYPATAVIEYLLNLANSNFEDWRKQNPLVSHAEFMLDIKKLGASGALFDFTKLNNISKEVISRYNAAQVYQASYTWAEAYDPALFSLMTEHVAYVKAILAIERSEQASARKDISKWSDIKAEISYFFDDFTVDPALIACYLPAMTQDDMRAIIKGFVATYAANDAKPVWFAKLQAIAADLGYARSTKEFKERPTLYKGHVADIATLLRLLITGRMQSPDLYAIMQVMGLERVMQRALALTG